MANVMNLQASIKLWQLVFIPVALLSIGCGTTDSEVASTNDKVFVEAMAPVSVQNISATAFTLDTNQHYRGLAIDTCNKRIIVSGSSGDIRMGDYKDTINWKMGWNVDSLHFRDVEIFGNKVFLTSIASPGYIKEGKTSANLSASKAEWKTRLFVTDTNVFMDGMDFWKNGMGLVYGDPLDGYHYILKTENEGQAWGRLSKRILPEPIQDEAGFAASGTGVVCLNDGVAYIGWGGEKARLFKTEDYGESWSIIETPIAHGKAGKGIYCMAWKNEMEGVIAGGNWEEPEGDSCYAYTRDGGKTWSLGTGGSGYRSGICHSHDDVYFSVGTRGTDISLDGGTSWIQVNELNLNAIVADPELRKSFGVGSYGKGLIISY